MLFASVTRDAPHVHGELGSINALLSWVLRIGDIAAIVGAGIFAYWLRFGVQAVDLEYLRHISRGVLFAFVVLTFAPLYRSWRGRGLSAELWSMCTAYGLMFTLAALYAAAMQLTNEISRLWWAAWLVGAVALGAGVRVVVRSAAGWIRTRGYDLRTAVLVGDACDAMRIIGQVERHHSAGIRMLGWFAVNDVNDPHGSMPRLGRLAELAAYVEEAQINQVWVVLPLSAQAQISEVLEELAHSTVDIKFVPDMLGLQLMSHSVELVAGLPVINLRASPLDGDARLLKALEDRVLALAILCLIAPLMLLIAIAVKLSSPGPVLFRQKRHGLDGRVIEVWKFRSMHLHSEDNGAVTQATPGDARVTPLGRFLRRTSLDELPQFFNVLQGTMSIVGPRPHAVAHNHQFKALVQDYMQRHRVKPGITGWAQVNGLRGETDTLDKMARRVEFDLFYMQNWSLLLDLRIILTTVVKGFIGRNAY